MGDGPPLVEGPSRPCIAGPSNSHFSAKYRMLVSIRHPLWPIRQFRVSPLSKMLDRLYPSPYIP